jgi:hypothetical protein
MRYSLGSFTTLEEAVSVSGIDYKDQAWRSDWWAYDAEKSIDLAVLLHYPRLLSGLFVYRFTCSGSGNLKRQLFTSRLHVQRVALLDVPSQELLGQRILQVFLHSTAHRPSAVGWIVSLVDQQLDCGRIQVNPDILGVSVSGIYVRVQQTP